MSAGGRRSPFVRVRVVPGVFCVGGRGQVLGGCVTACVCGCAWARERGLVCAGRVACTLFGSALTGCASGGVFGVCGFRLPARAPCLSVR